jgi:multidrug efflux pump subunit AcrB
MAVPPALFGAALFLAVFRSSLNINSIMAFVTLFGTSVNCSIILRQCGTKGFSSVLITTATSLASLAPFAFDPFNLNPQSSLALAMTGGLLFSAAASLILVPIATEGKNGRE